MKKLIAFNMLMLSACSMAETPAAKPVFTKKEVATFNEPWAMTFLPGKEALALITEKKGKLLLFNTVTATSQEVAGVPKVEYGGQGGFGDVITHPNFAKNKTIYLSWVEAGEGGRGAVVGKAKLVEGDAPKLEGLTIIWRQAPKVEGKGHFGHRLAFGPDGKLYISSGERQKFDPAQDLKSNLGKVVRLNEDGSTPKDNPFASQGGIAAQIWSYGHRNPLGIAFDSKGRLWQQEMGPRHGDELNLAIKGKNYGYPKVSNGNHYDGRDIPDHKEGDGFEAPKVFWVPAISPAGLMIYSGQRFPQWKGNAFLGGLSSKALVRVVLDGEKATKGDQWDMGARIREVEQGPNGEIYVLEDGDKAKLWKLLP